MRNRVSVLHGVNLDALDRRPASIYGDLTFSALERRIELYCKELGLEPRFFQSNHEGDFVEELHKSRDFCDALLLNPGAWTHYAWAIRDALEIASLPSVEVHLSDITAREDWRGVSVIGELCITSIYGKGPEGYREGLSVLKDTLSA